MIIIPSKWLFHWEYSLFSDKPIYLSTILEHEQFPFQCFTAGMWWCGGYWMIWGDIGNGWIEFSLINKFFNPPLRILQHQGWPTFITEDLGWLPRMQPGCPCDTVKVNNGQRGSCHGFCIISDNIPASWDTGESSMARTILLMIAVLALWYCLIPSEPTYSDYLKVSNYESATLQLATCNFKDM